MSSGTDTFDSDSDNSETDFDDARYASRNDHDGLEDDRDVLFSPTAAPVRQSDTFGSPASAPSPQTHYLYNAIPGPSIISNSSIQGNPAHLLAEALETTPLVRKLSISFAPQTPPSSSGHGVNATLSDDANPSPSLGHYIAPDGLKKHRRPSTTTVGSQRSNRSRGSRTDGPNGLDDDGVLRETKGDSLYTHKGKSTFGQSVSI